MKNVIRQRGKRFGERADNIQTVLMLASVNLEIRMRTAKFRSNFTVSADFFGFSHTIVFLESLFFHSVLFEDFENAWSYSSLGNKSLAAQIAFSRQKEAARRKRTPMGV